MTQDPAHHEGFSIEIDKKHYRAPKTPMTGLELRRLADPPIGDDRDLFEVVPHGDDLKIADDQPVEMKNGLHFYSAPKTINPGSTDAVA
jgi:hypothetical protein